MEGSGEIREKGGQEDQKRRFSLFCTFLVLIVYSLVREIGLLGEIFQMNPKCANPDNLNLNFSELLIVHL